MQEIGIHTLILHVRQLSSESTLFKVILLFGPPKTQVYLTLNYNPDNKVSFKCLHLPN